MTAIYIADENAESIKALLTLAAEGLAAEVLEGTEQEKAAVQLGRELGRRPARVVLSCNGSHAEYDWPQEWERAVRDYARGTALGAAVTIRQTPQQVTA